MPVPAFVEILTFLMPLVIVATVAVLITGENYPLMGFSIDMPDVYTSVLYWFSWVWVVMAAVSTFSVWHFSKLYGETVHTFFTWAITVSALPLFVFLITTH